MAKLQCHWHRWHWQLFSKLINIGNRSSLAVRFLRPDIEKGLRPVQKHWLNHLVIKVALWPPVKFSTVSSTDNTNDKSCARCLRRLESNDISYMLPGCRAIGIYDLCTFLSYFVFLKFFSAYLFSNNQIFNFSWRYYFNPPSIERPLLAVKASFEYNIQIQINKFM